jgi:pantoate--beta-alanine ligase
MQTVSAKSELRRLISGWRAAGDRIAVVPTMGSLHEGHLSLVQVARQNADRVVVTVFVNPTQFGPNEDFDIYPRTLDSDAAKLAAAEADLLFAPDVASVYPFGIESATRVVVPSLTDKLCGASRPGHFDGVTSVVARLFALVQPDVAVFGQKDFQQQLVIRRMVEDLGLPIEITVAPIVREADGLAMSSRNAFLGANERTAATSIYRVLTDIAVALQGGDRNFSALEANATQQLRASLRSVEYFAIRQAADLDPPLADSRQLVVLAAGFVGDVRLIDNVLVNLE